MTAGRPLRNAAAGRQRHRVAREFQCFESKALLRQHAG